MDKIVKEMQQKILLIADPESGYTMEDFEKEYNNMNYNQNQVQKIDYSKMQINFKFKNGIIPTGLYFEIPENFEIQVRPRSGLAAKNGVTVLNTPGTVDADYRGEVKVILINHSDNAFVVNHGDRIAQAVIASVIGKNFVKLEKVNNIDEKTERGSGGFGSTGVK